MYKHAVMTSIQLVFFVVAWRQPHATTSYLSTCCPLLLCHLQDYYLHIRLASTEVASQQLKNDVLTIFSTLPEIFSFHKKWDILYLGVDGGEFCANRTSNCFGLFVLPTSVCFSPRWNSVTGREMLMASWNASWSMWVVCTAFEDFIVTDADALIHECCDIIWRAFFIAELYKFGNGISVVWNCTQRRAILYNSHEQFVASTITTCFSPVSSPFHCSPLPAFSLLQKLEFHVYLSYCKNKPTSDGARAGHENYFTQRRQSLNQKLDIEDLLIAPVQRLPKYQLLIRVGQHVVCMVVGHMVAL